MLELFVSGFRITALFLVLVFIVIISIKETREQKEINTLIQERIIDRLLLKFETEKIYVLEGITITKLSELIGEKEYMVRRAINGVLAYTNFNSFLNHYRIIEGCRLIEKNQLKELTYQEIAYQLGYQSIATFNRAFKKETGLTPSEYSDQKISP